MKTETMLDALAKELWGGQSLLVRGHDGKYYNIFNGTWSHVPKPYSPVLVTEAYKYYVLPNILNETKFKEALKKIIKPTYFKYMTTNRMEWLYWTREAKFVWGTPMCRGDNLKFGGHITKSGEVEKVMLAPLFGKGKKS